MVSKELDKIFESREVIRAHAYAAGAHGAIGQVRLYTGEPYIEHPQRVAFNYCYYCYSTGLDDKAVAAALLHDVVEDTQVSINDLGFVFAPAVIRYVEALTNVSTHEQPALNRAARKTLDRERLSQAPAVSQSIKCADIMDNVHCIARHDPGFGRTYIQEAYDLLAILQDAALPIREATQARVDHAAKMIDEAVAVAARQTNKEISGNAAHRE